MFLQKVNILNYKNISEISYDFDEKLNAFVGKNGVGKTNLLDAIYHLSTGKSYFNPITIQNIKHQEDFFVIDGVFLKENREEHIVCSLKKGQKKVLKRNNKLYAKFSEYYGLIPVVIISPSDNDLVIEGSETRRKFIDSIISGTDSDYLNDLIAYQKTVSQRNALLKYFAANQTFDADNLQIYNDLMVQFGEAIFKKRTHFLNQFLAIFKKYYQIISENSEEVTIKYNSQLENNNFQNLLNESLAKDKIIQYTTVGIHKDDLELIINQYPLKKFGSQGQQKSFLIALKLAQFEFMKNQVKTLPILLFDDIFDKLDQYRVQQIINLVNQNVFGQIFISDTHPERTENILKQTEKSYKTFTF